MSETIATCQLPDTQGDSDAALEQILRYGEKADAQDVAVLCFPECYFTGYTRDKQTAEQCAITLDGSAFQTLLGQTATLKTTLIISLIERNETRLYNTAAVLQHGKLIGTYRKTHPNEGIFEAGMESPTFTVGRLAFGINICNDANYPEAAAQLLPGNPKVIFYPLNNRLPLETAEKWRNRHVRNLVDRATQTGCWIASSDIFCKDDASVGYGFTAIVNPGGTVTNQATELAEQLITARIH